MYVMFVTLFSAQTQLECVACSYINHVVLCMLLMLTFSVAFLGCI